MDVKFSKEEIMMINTLNDIGKREDFTEHAAKIEATAEIPHDMLPKSAETR